jgi:hypothetical protein
MTFPHKPTERNIRDYALHLALIVRRRARAIIGRNALSWNVPPSKSSLATPPSSPLCRPFERHRHNPDEGTHCLGKCQRVIPACGD